MKDMVRNWLNALKNESSTVLQFSLPISWENNV